MMRAVLLAAVLLLSHLSKRDCLSWRDTSGYHISGPQSFLASHFPSHRLVSFHWDSGASGPEVVSHGRASLSAQSFQRLCHRAVSSSGSLLQSMRPSTSYSAAQPELSFITTPGTPTTAPAAPPTISPNAATRAPTPRPTLRPTAPPPTSPVYTVVTVSATNKLTGITASKFNAEAKLAFRVAVAATITKITENSIFITAARDARAVRRRLQLLDDVREIIDSKAALGRDLTESALLVDWVAVLIMELYGYSQPAPFFSAVSKTLTSAMTSGNFTSLLTELEASIYRNTSAAIESLSYVVQSSPTAAPVRSASPTEPKSTKHPNYDAIALAIALPVVVVTVAALCYAYNFYYHWKFRLVLQGKQVMDESVAGASDRTATSWHWSIGRLFGYCQRSHVPSTTRRIVRRKLHSNSSNKLTAVVPEVVVGTKNNNSNNSPELVRDDNNSSKRSLKISSVLPESEDSRSAQPSPSRLVFNRHQVSPAPFALGASSSGKEATTRSADNVAAQPFPSSPTRLRLPPLSLSDTPNLQNAAKSPARIVLTPSGKTRLVHNVSGFNDSVGVTTS